MVSDTQLDAIIASVARGTPPGQAATAAGVSGETLRRWSAIARGEQTWPGSQDSAVDDATRDRIVRFVDRLSRAQAECFTVLTHSLYENATTPNEKTGWYDTQAADKLLSKHPSYRKHWHEERHLVQEGAIQHNHTMQRLEQLSNEELHALADAQPTLPDLTNAPDQPDE